MNCVLLRYVYMLLMLLTLVVVYCILSFISSMHTSYRRGYDPGDVLSEGSLVQPCLKREDIDLGSNRGVMSGHLLQDYVFHIQMRGMRL